MENNALISVEVAYALPAKQKIISLQLESGATAYDAAEQSGIVKLFPEIELNVVAMGIFGKSVKPKEHVMSEGERVEIYRPLLSDPKEVRKKRAAEAKAKRAKG